MGADVIALADAAAAAAPEPSSLDLFLRPLEALLGDPAVTDICINRPGEAYVERDAGWSREAIPFASYDWCLSLAKLVAHHARQRVSSSEPLLSATLPSGPRIQIVLPPAAEDGTVSITIRRPSNVLWTLDDLARMGVFAEVRVLPARREALGDVERQLFDLLDRRDIASFLRRAVHLRRNILLSGATGSGKTTISKALILEIPSDERIVTIEDVAELSLANQPNHVRLFYSQGGQGQAAIGAGELLASAKRQRPDRVFVSELRTGEEVYDYLVSINTGHPGSITSVHADSAQLAFVALAQLMKRSVAGQGMTTRDGVELAQLSIDVVVQCARVGRRRLVSEIWYDPDTRRRGLR
ncbi:MAG: P-type DNA transfer ATPase VirB11 [Proteobacteria bacterium]|nr:P-type DNA transfer ATPase VirB11 [Pseudomonadota bacterium]